MGEGRGCGVFQEDSKRESFVTKPLVRVTGGMNTLHYFEETSFGRKSTFQ